MSILFQITMLLEFMFQGYCQYVYFSALMKRKLSPIIILPLFLLASCAGYILYRSFYNPWFNIASVIIISFVLCIICYKAHIGVIILHSCIAGCMLVLFELMTAPAINFVMQDNYLESHAEISELLISTFSKLIMFTVCMLIKQIAEKELHKTKSAWLFIVPLMSVFLVYGLYYLFGAEIDINKYHTVLAISFMVLLVINIVVFKVHEDYVRSANEASRAKLLDQKKELDYESYKLLQKNYDDSRILIHDIKHHLNVISSMAENEDLKQYLASLKAQEYFNPSQNLTGNKIIDIIIYQKSEICRNKGIELSFTHNNIRFNFIEEADICCILSNLIDNAIESAERSSEKTIDIVFFSRSESGPFFIEIENSCDIPPDIKDGRLITAKKDKNKHGLGIISAEKTVRKYDGELNFQYEADQRRFRISAMLNK